MSCKNYKGIASSHKVGGRPIVSGQFVLCHGRINPDEICEVFFNPDFGFKIQGNNLADAYVTGIVVEVSPWSSFIGNASLILDNILSRWQIIERK